MDQTTDLNGAVAIVTGAGGGIGSALAVRLGSVGMALVLADLDGSHLEETAARLPAGTRVELVVGDVADADHHAELVDTADGLGRLNLTVLNAGVCLPGLVWEMPIEQWRIQMDVNFWGVLHGVRAAVPNMIGRGGGHVVAVASGAGLVSTPGLAPYVASKHAVVGLMESLRHELNRVAPDVHASVVCPGNIQTPITANSLAAAGVTDEALSEGVAAIASRVRGDVEAGAKPDVVVDAIIDAVNTNRFWVLPQPAVAWGAEDRVARIKDGREPADLLL